MDEFEEVMKDRDLSYQLLEKVLDLQVAGHTAAAAQSADGKKKVKDLKSILDALGPHPASIFDRFSDWPRLDRPSPAHHGSS